MHAFRIWPKKGPTTRKLLGQSGCPGRGRTYDQVINSYLFKVYSLVFNNPKRLHLCDSFQSEFYS